jgi:hypothetical protein
VATFRAGMPHANLMMMLIDMPVLGVSLDDQLSFA